MHFHFFSCFKFYFSLSGLVKTNSNKITMETKPYNKVVKKYTCHGIKNHSFFNWINFLIFVSAQLHTVRGPLDLFTFGIRVFIQQPECVLKLIWSGSGIWTRGFDLGKVALYHWVIPAHLNFVNKQGGA